MQYKHILVPVDGSKLSEYAFLKAVNTAVRNNAALTIGHVIDVRTYANVEATGGSIHQNAVKYTEQMLEGYKRVALDHGVQAVNTVIDSGAARNIVPKVMAEDAGADLIICGAAGMHAFERFVMGSVSEAIVRYAKCDVLVVKPAEMPEDFDVIDSTKAFREEYNTDI